MRSSEVYQWEEAVVREYLGRKYPKRLRRLLKTNSEGWTEAQRADWQAYHGLKPPAGTFRYLHVSTQPKSRKGSGVTFKRTPEKGEIL